MKKMLTRLCNRASICTTIRFLQVCRFMFLERRECVRSQMTKGKEPDVVMAALQTENAHRVQTDVVGKKKCCTSISFNGVLFFVQEIMKDGSGT